MIIHIIMFLENNRPTFNANFELRTYVHVWGYYTYNMIVAALGEEFVLQHKLMI